MQALLPVRSQDAFEEYYRQPTQALRNRLVEENLGLARKVAHAISLQSFEPYEDLRQIADMVLIDCVEKFDPSKGYRFSTFALSRLRGRLLNYLRDKGHTIRIPRKYYDLTQKAKRVEKAFCESRGRRPSPKEIANEMQITFELYLASRQAVTGCRYFLPESACDNYAVTDSRVEPDLDVSLEPLGDLEKKVVTKFFYSKSSLEKIAKQMQVTQPEVKQVLRKAIIKIKVIDYSLPVAS